MPFWIIFLVHICIFLNAFFVFICTRLVEGIESWTLMIYVFINLFQMPGSTSTAPCNSNSVNQKASSESHHNDGDHFMSFCLSFVLINIVYLFWVLYYLFSKLSLISLDSGLSLFVFGQGIASIDSKVWDNTIYSTYHVFVFLICMF